MAMTGTASQVEWAERIRLNVAEEFDRVARALKVQAGKQPEQARAETHTLIAILEEKRTETMANEQAGYFIRDWQELSDQVRRMIAMDPRYQTIQADRVARRKNAGGKDTDGQAITETT